MTEAKGELDCITAEVDSLRDEISAPRVEPS
jgi:hypothetical protein